MKNRSAYITIIILIAIIVIGGLYILYVKNKNESDTLQRSPAAQALISSDGGYTDLDGNTVSLQNYLGKKIIVLSWASWCPQCATQLESLGNFSHDDSIVILAINRAEPKSTAKSFLEFYNVEEKVQLVLDSSDHFYKSIGGYTMPETLIYNERGEVLLHERGVISIDRINQVIK